MGRSKHRTVAQSAKREGKPLAAALVVIIIWIIVGVLL